MAALIGDFAGSRKMATVFGFVTCIFGLGQIAGPVVGGSIAQKADSFFFSFLMILICALLAMMLSAFLPRKDGSSPEK